LPSARTTRNGCFAGIVFGFGMAIGAVNFMAGCSVEKDACFTERHPMDQTPSFHPVYKAMNKPLTILGAERRLFFLAAILGGATFNFFGSWPGDC